MENPIKMDDLGVPLFLETSIWVNILMLCLFGIFGFQPWKKNGPIKFIWKFTQTGFNALLTLCLYPWILLQYFSSRDPYAPCKNGSLYSNYPCIFGQPMFWSLLICNRLIAMKFIRKIHVQKGNRCLQQLRQTDTFKQNSNWATLKPWRETTKPIHHWLR